MDELISSDLLPWAIGDVSRKHWLCRGKGSVLSADDALADIVSLVVRALVWQMRGIGFDSHQGHFPFSVI